MLCQPHTHGQHERVALVARGHPKTTLTHDTLLPIIQTNNGFICNTLVHIYNIVMTDTDTTHSAVCAITSPHDLENALQNAGDAVILLDFWAPWCEPCKALTPLLEKCVKKYAPHARLLTINVDEHQHLAMHFRVQSIPTVKIVKKGRLVDEFIGAQEEHAIDEKIRKHLPQAATAEDPKEAAIAAARAGDWARAQSLVTTILSQNPQDVKALLLKARCALARNDCETARTTLDAITDAAAIDERDTLRDMTALREQCAQKEASGVYAARATKEPENLDLIYDWACALIAENNYPAACEALLSSIQLNPAYKDGAARKLLLLVFMLMGDATPDVTTYRSRLAQALYV